MGIIGRVGTLRGESSGPSLPLAGVNCKSQLAGKQPALSGGGMSLPIMFDVFSSDRVRGSGGEVLGARAMVDVLEERRLMSASVEQGMSLFAGPVGPAVEAGLERRYQRDRRWQDRSDRTERRQRPQDVQCRPDRRRRRPRRPARHRRRGRVAGKGTRPHGRRAADAEGQQSRRRLLHRARSQGQHAACDHERAGGRAPLRATCSQREARACRVDRGRFGVRFADASQAPAG